MKTLINLRYPLFFAISMVLGILCTVAFVYGLWFYVVLFFAVFLLATLLPYASNKLKKLKKAMLVMLVGIVLGLSVSSLNYTVLKNQRIYDDSATNTLETHLIGTLTDNVVKGENYTLMELRDCTVVTETEYGTQYEKLKGNVTLFTFMVAFPIDVNGIDCSAGNIVEAKGVISDVYLLKVGMVETYAYRRNVWYNFDQVTSLVVTPSHNSTFDEDARLYIKNTLTNNMACNSDIAYALLVGDKSLMNDDDLLNFQNAGIIHALAVSGLHVSFIVAVLSFIPKKLKLSPFIRLLFIMLPLIFYTYICNFSPSVVRAVIMAFVMLFSRCIGARSDLLNSLSIAAILILLFKPFYIFDVGFLLSFSAIFGIATFGIAANRWQRRKKVPHAIGYFISVFLMSVGVNLSTMALIAHYFRKISLMGFVSNIVAIPAITLIFILTMLGQIPFLNFLLWLPDKLLTYLKTFASYAGNTPISVYYLIGFGSAVVLIYLWLFIFGGYINLGKPKWRNITLIVLAILIVVVMVYEVTPENADYEVFVSSTYSHGLILMTDDQNRAYSIGSFSTQGDVESIIDFLSFKPIDELQLFVYDFKSVKPSVFATLYSQYNLTKVYIFDFSANDEIELYYEDVTFIRVPKDFETNGAISVKSITDGPLAALYVVMPNMEFALATTTNQNILKNLHLKLPASMNFIYCPYIGIEALDFFPDTVVLTKSSPNAENLYSLSRYGNFTFSSISDIMRLQKIKN